MVRLWKRHIVLLVWFSVVLVVALSALPSLAQAPDFRLVRLWMGAPDGAKEAVVAIDWGDGGTCLVWGYRWNEGRVDGRTMIEAIKAGDTRFFERETGGGGFPTTIYGLGYDQDDDGFPGIQEQEGDASTPIDQDDRYREGWRTSGFWRLCQSTDSAGRVWDECATVTSKTIDDGGAFVAHYCPDFRCDSLPDPAACVAAAPANARPSLNNVSLSGNEDTTIPFTTNIFEPAAFTDADGDLLATIRILSLPDHGTLVYSDSTVAAGAVPYEIEAGTIGLLSFVPPADWYGTASFAWNGSDGVAYADSSAVVTITVAPVNDPPDLADDTVTTEEDRPITIDVLANDYDRDGTLDPSTVTVIRATVQGTTRVMTASGAITYTPPTDFSGTTRFAYDVCDDGTPGRTCATATVSLTVLPVNDPPTFTAGADQTVMQDSGLQRVEQWATDVLCGPQNEADQTCAFVTTNENPALFSVQPFISPEGTLVYSPTSGVSGSARVTVALQDDGGTTSGGSDSSGPHVFTITVLAKPTAIDVLRFTASSGENGVDIVWETGAERNTRGFVLWRSGDGRRDHAEQRTPEMIPSRGGSSTGATYLWQDTQVEQGASYTYWLHEQELDGATTEYGPTRAVWQLQSDHSVFLPLVVR